MSSELNNSLKIDISSPAALRASCEGHSPEDILQALKAPNEFGNTHMNDIARKADPELMRAALEKLSSEQCVVALILQDDLWWASSLHLLIEPNADFGHAMVEKLEPEHLYQLLTAEHSLFKSYWYTQYSPDLLHAVLEKLLPEQRLHILTLKELPKNSLMALAGLESDREPIYFPSTKLMPTALEMLNPEQRLEFFKLQKYSGASLFHHMESEGSVKFIPDMLKWFSPEQRLEILMQKDRDEGDLLNAFARADDPALIRALLAGISQEHRLQALMAPHKRGNAIDIIADKNNPDLLRAALEGLSSEQRMHALTSKQWPHYGIALYKLATTGNSDLMRTALETLSPEQRFKCLVSKGEKNNVMHQLAGKGDADLMRTALSGFSPQQYMEVMTLKDSNEETPLHWATRNPEAMRVMLNVLSHNQRLNILKVEDKDGDSVLDGIAYRTRSRKNSVASMRTIVESFLYPNNQAEIDMPGEKKLKASLLQISKSKPDLYSELADLISRAYPVKTPKQKITASLKRAKAHRITSGTEPT